MMNDESTTLSEAGSARRGEILGLARGALRRRTAWRRARNGGGALAVAALAAGAAVYSLRPAAHTGGTEIAREESSGAAIVVVRTDPGILDRVTVSDEELLRLLNEAGEDGLVRVGGRTMLASEIPLAGGEKGPPSGQTTPGSSGARAL